MTNPAPGAPAPSVFSFDAHSVRSLMIDDQPWFIANDIARALGYTNPRKAIADHVDEDDRADVTIRDGSQSRSVNAINESGMYSLILRSKKEEAKRFKKWVTSEVLPTIRKTGQYTAPITITPEQQNALQQIVARKTGKDGKKRAGLWSRFNNHFKLGSYKQLLQIINMAALSMANTSDYFEKKARTQETGSK